MLPFGEPLLLPYMRPEGRPKRPAIKNRPVQGGPGECRRLFLDLLRRRLPYPPDLSVGAAYLPPFAVRLQDPDDAAFF